MPPKSKTKTKSRTKEDWTFEVTVRFVPVPDEKREAYQAFIRWTVEQIIEEMQKEMEQSDINQIESEVI